MNAIKIAATCLIALLLGACATVSSNYGNSRADQKGLAYYLPKGLIEVKLVETGGKFDVTISGPIMVADRAYRLHADLRKAALSDNKVEITIDPQTQLLETVDVRSVGRAGEIIENIYPAIPGVQAYQRGFVDDGLPVEVFTALYEPKDLEQAGRDVSQAIMTYIGRICGTQDRPVRRFSPRCAVWEELEVNRPDIVKLSIDAPFGGTTANMNLGKCGRGLCYRPLVPVKVRSEIGGLFVNEDFYMVPDTTTVSYYTLPSGMFSTQEYDLTFEQGVLVEVEQIQESEVLGFSRLPTQILREIIAAPVDAVTGRRTGTGAPVTQTDRRTNRDDVRGGDGGGGRGDRSSDPGESSFNKTRTLTIGRSVTQRRQFRDEGQVPNEYQQYLQRQTEPEPAPLAPPPTRVIIEHVLPQPQPSGEPQQ